MKQKTKKKKLYFKILKKAMKIRYKRPAFVYLGNKFEDGTIIISNHEGTDAPMALEIYHPSPMRMWGAHEMNSGLKQMYKYQTKVYYHEKKHWNLFGARMFCLLASPLTNMFYSGFNLISTYRDERFIKTIRESSATLLNKENIVIFPEDSTNGYLAEIEGMHLGFVVLAEAMLRRGNDIPICVSYYKKDQNVYIFDNPILYSELKKDCNNKQEIADKIRLRCNQLGKMNFDKEFIKQTKKQNKLDTKTQKKSKQK